MNISFKKVNISENIFYGAIKGEFLRIVSSRDFIPKARELSERMKRQG